MRVLPCCIVGGAVTGAISMAVGAKLMAPHGGLFVLLIPGAITPVLGYLLAIVAGTLVAGLAYAVLKRPEAQTAEVEKRHNPTAIKADCSALLSLFTPLRQSAAPAARQSLPPRYPG